jgi:hypothetical protein
VEEMGPAEVRARPAAPCQPRRCRPRRRSSGRAPGASTEPTTVPTAVPPARCTSPLRRARAARAARRDGGGRGGASAVVRPHRAPRHSPRWCVRGGVSAVVCPHRTPRDPPRWCVRARERRDARRVLAPRPEVGPRSEAGRARRCSQFWPPKTCSRAPGRYFLWDPSFHSKIPRTQNKFLRARIATRALHSHEAFGVSRTPTWPTLHVGRGRSMRV